MHSFQSNGFHFNFNSDLSGEIEIIDLTSGHRIWVNSESLLDFVAEIIRQNQLDRLEEMNTDELLGLE